MIRKTQNMCSRCYNVYDGAFIITRLTTGSKVKCDFCKKKEFGYVVSVQYDEKRNREDTEKIS